MKTILERRIREAVAGRPYQNYCRAREAVLEMLGHEPVGTESEPSRYWQAELAGIEYLFDASPLLVQNLRHHCHHFTGIREYDYRPHHSHQAGLFAKKLAMLRVEDQTGLAVSEARELGGFGHEIGGSFWNLDTLRFYECMIALDRGWALQGFGHGDRPMVVEIGSGWGGFAHQFKTLFPRTTYMLVDFPAALLVSATYLQTVFPEARVLFLSGEAPVYDDAIAPRSYDFIFAPHYVWPRLGFRPPELVINMVSFQEMTTDQVHSYVGRCASWGVPTLYSFNRDRSRHNRELTSVSGVLGQHYRMKDVRVLDLSASHLPPTGLARYKRIVKKILSRSIGWPRHKPELDYRHLIGRLP